MRLPDDVLLSILGSLPRDSLDAVAITNRRLDELCATNFAVYPLRWATMTVYCGADYATVGTNKAYKTADFESLALYLRHAMLSDLTLSGPVDERIVELLMPFRDRFRAAKMEHKSRTGSCFASAEAFRRAYSELLVCRHFLISPSSLSGSPLDVIGVNAGLLTLPCLQQCPSLYFMSMPLADAADITAWLTSGGEKTLRIHYTGPDVFIRRLIKKVVKQFRSATTASAFAVSVFGETTGVTGAKAKIFTNPTTSEKLVFLVQRDPSAHPYVWQQTVMKRSKDEP